MMRMIAAAAALAAVVAQNSWSVISSQVGQGASGLAFFDANTGIIATSDGFLGYNTYLSTDGGKTWATTPNQAGYFPMLSDTSAYGSVGVACGAATQFTLNKGANFNNSIGGNGGTISRVIADQSGFGLVGLFGSTNGVAISTDGGITFTPHDAGLQIDSSYAAFPSATTWYVTGADAPQSSDDQTDQTTSSGSGSTTSSGSGSTTSANSNGVYVRRLTRHLSIHSTVNGPARHVYTLPAKQGFSLRGRTLQSNTTGYAAQITKTTDGGSTFTSQYYTTNQFALNGIDCQDVNNCCTVGEAQSGAAEGAYILCTTNGGANWTTNYNSTTAGDVLIDIRAVGNSVYWAVGGNIGTSSISASWFHSADNGATWTADTTLSNYLATGIECLSGTSSCWSTVVDNNDNSYVAAN